MDFTTYFNTYKESFYPELSSPEFSSPELSSPQLSSPEPDFIDEDLWCRASNLRQLKKYMYPLIIDNASSKTMIQQNSVSEVSLSEDITKLEQKRRVSFSDDFGYPLTHVRVVPSRNNSSYGSDGDSEFASDYSEDSLSDITDDYLHDVFTCTASTPQTTSSYNQIDLYFPIRRIDKSLGPLVCLFPQPAGDYTKMCFKLSRDNVAMENLRVENNNKMLGSIRVKNIGFHKSVHVRLTVDQWESHRNISCKYAGPLVPGKSYASHDLDIYTFEVAIASADRTVCFAVRYQVQDQEFWDNNDGRNYTLKRTCHLGIK